ncbi:MAG: hypothetical protein JXR61_04010 [Prolixibacteraceae bacterium]|nr:hypothetical protein [Prolixibacteraceae bacterium]
MKMERPSKDLMNENFVKIMPVNLLLSQSIFDDPPITIEGINNLDINVDYTIEVGFGRFIPLYKITKFNSQFNVNWSGIVMHNGKAVKLSKSGSLHFSGKYKITGLCSAKMTKQQIQNAVIRQVKDKISEDIENEVKKNISFTNSL